MLPARPELATLDSAVDTGFRVFAVVCAAGMLLSRLVAPPASDRQPNLPETRPFPRSSDQGDLRKAV